MHFRTIRRAVIGTATAALVASPIVAAAEPPDDVDRLASQIAEVAPDQGEVVVPRQNGRSKKTGHAKHAESMVAHAGGVMTEVMHPLSPSKPATVEISDPDLDIPQIEVSLPGEIEVSEGKVAADGTIVYQATDGGSDAAVQALDDGSVRLQTIIPNSDAQHEFTYTFGGDIVPLENEDGAIELVKEFDGGVVSVGVVDEAWAADAHGNDVETSYRIEGNDLVQSVETDSRTPYPIVADPRFTTGPLYFNVYFNRHETRNMRDASGVAAAAAGVGTAFAGPVGTAAGAVIAANAAIVATLASRWYGDGMCLRIGWYGGLPPAGTWAPTPHDGRFCT